MKILVVNNSDSIGGAAIAAFRLHKALLNQGICSQMLVQNKQTVESTVISKQNAFAKIAAILRQYIELLPVRLYMKRTRILFSPDWLPFSGTIKKIQTINPDIVHLHWTHLGMMSTQDLPNINRPIIFTLHDNWAFTGGCHVKWTCEGFKEKCGKCPHLGSKYGFDLSRLLWRQKHRIFSRLSNITFVAPSTWMAEMAKQSSLLKHENIHVVPNPIDITVFKPLDKANSRILWNLPAHKKLILFGAVGALTDQNKGFNELVEALEKISSTGFELVIFGSSGITDAEKKFKIKTHFLGYINDDVSLATIYNSADVMVVPSRQESFGLTASEALSCGVPVVAFETSGLIDIVDHKINGYLARPFQSSDLANGITWVLDHDDPALLSSNARKKVLENFDSSLVAKRYIELYKRVLNESV